MEGLRLISILLIASAAIAGCDRSSGTAGKSEKVSVLATVLPLADVARQVGGQFVSTDWVVESGQSLADVHLDAALRNRFRLADIILMGGVSEPWASPSFVDPDVNLRIIRLDLLQSAHDIPATGLLWLDPVVVKDCARDLAARLSVQRPEHEEFFRQRADRFNASLDALMGEYQPRFSSARNKRFLTLSTDFNPLLARFGLEPVLVVEALPAQLTEEQITTLRLVSRDRDTRMLIVPADTPAVVISDLEQRSGGLKIVSLDALGSSALRARNEYMEILSYDLSQLIAATVAAAAQPPR